MRRVNPKVFLVAETKIRHDGLNEYLNHVGALGEWTSDAISDGEVLVEAMGRLCYRSWKPGLNANVTKVREGNDVYLKHILEVGHGSVLEHATMSFIFADVSRVFTHELVRHRAGMAFSQESLRYVRLTDLGLWLPEQMQKDPRMVELFETTFRSLEEIQLKLAEHFNLDHLPMSEKKILTSTMRRLAPIGLATAIGVTFNARSLRHVIQMRTSETAEEEIRLVFDQVATIACKRWPNLMQDFVRGPLGAWVPKNSKI